MLGYLMPFMLGALVSAAYRTRRRRTPSAPGHDHTAPHAEPDTAAPPRDTRAPKMRRPSEREVLLQTLLEHNEQLLDECHDKLQQQADILNELEQRQEQSQILLVAFQRQRTADLAKHRKQQAAISELQRRQEQYQLLVAAFLQQRDADHAKIEALEQEVRALNAELQRLRGSLPGADE